MNQVMAPCLAEEELTGLRTIGIHLKDKISIPKSGLTCPVLHKIHHQWNNNELVKLKFHDFLSQNMKLALDIVQMAERNVAANSSLERNSLAYLDQRMAMAKRCSHEGVMAGAKAAVVATIATAIPTLASVRMLPWARANLNHTAQALIISTVAGAAYFIVADKTVLATARKNSFNRSSNA